MPPPRANAAVDERPTQRATQRTESFFMIGLHRSPDNARVGDRFVQFYEIAPPQYRGDWSGAIRVANAQNGKSHPRRQLMETILSTREERLARGTLCPAID